ncbi:hypothetical protein WCWAEYFT_CDS0104 [Vibrio phage VB_VaC_TDDLMA]
MSKCQYARFLELRTKKAKRGFGNRKKEIEQEMKFNNSMLNHILIINSGGDMSSANKVRDEMKAMNDELETIVQ